MGNIVTFLDLQSLIFMQSRGIEYNADVIHSGCSMCTWSLSKAALTEQDDEEILAILSQKVLILFSKDFNFFYFTFSNI